MSTSILGGFLLSAFLIAVYLLCSKTHEPKVGEVVHEESPKKKRGS
jgi:hypothetical protein